MDQFGKYQMLRRVGVGGMAEVFLARTTVAHGLSKQLVIKKIHPAHARSSQFVSMFVDEAKIALSLNHPNIVQVFDFGQVGQTFFLAMEYIEGFDVLRIMKEHVGRGKRVPFDVAAFIVQEAVKGLDYAHRKTDDFGDPLEIVHRDISPQNLLVSWDGAVKIVDFGIARAQNTKEEEGVIKGKFAYMPPEQAKGGIVDRRADIFSAGVVLFELVCGRPLYNGKGQEALEQARMGALPRPRSLNPQIPVDLEATILKALAFDREDRFQTARDFQHALGKFQFQWAQSHEGIPIESGGLAQWLSRNIKRSKPSISVKTSAFAPIQTAPIESSVPLREMRTAREQIRERKPVFVLQGILAGRDQLEKRVGLSASLKLVGDFTQIARDIAFKHDATFEQPTDNGVRFIVGIPAAGEDDASRSIMLALALVEALDGIGNDVEPDLRLAVGIQRGTATITRNQDGLYSHTLVDQAASAASALANEARGAEVLVTSEVFRISQNDWNFEPLSTTSAGSSRIYRLRGIKERRQRLRERSTAIESVGRDLELKALRDAYRECLIHGDHKIIVIAADAGMGKRTLINTLLKTIPDNEASVMRATARPAMQHTPFGIIADFGRDAMGLAEGATPTEIRKRITMLLKLLWQSPGQLPGQENVSKEEDTFSELVDAACVLFGIQNKTDISLEPDLLRSRLHRISLKIEKKFAPNKPLIVIAENVHWADAESLRLTNDLLASGSTRGTLVLVTSRPESQIIQLAHHQRADLIRLSDLSEAHRVELISRRFPPAQDVDNLVKQILARTGGNPFFINEVLDSLIDQGVLAFDSEEKGLLRWVRSDVPIQIPTTVEALLATRIDRLPDKLKQTLLHASVLGMRFRSAELAQLQGASVLEDLPDLVERGVLRHDNPGHSFPNDMTMTVAYRMVPSEDRNELHQLAATNLRASSAYRRGRDDAKIARHLELAGESENAADQYVNAATHAMRAGSLGDAFFQLGRALKLWAPNDHKNRFLAHLKREEVLRRQVKRPLQKIEITALQVEAQALNLPSCLTVAFARLAEYQLDCGYLHEAEVSAKSALQYSRDANDQLAESEALRLRASIHRLQGNNDAALATCERALTLVDKHPAALQERAHILNNRGTILWRMNRLNEAIESYAETLVIYKNLQQPRKESGALNNMGIVFCALGEFEAGLVHYKGSLSIDQRLGDRAQVASTLGNIGQTYAELGSVARAEKYLRKALKLSEAYSDWAAILDILNSLGQVYLASGLLDQADGFLNRALEIAIENHDHYQEIRALVYLAQTRLQQGLDFADAKVLAKKATTMARQLPMPAGEIIGLSLQALISLKQGEAENGLQLSYAAVKKAETTEQSEGLELILHAHYKLCEANLLTNEAIQALERSTAEVHRKAGRLQDPNLRNCYLQSPPIRTIREDIDRVNQLK